MHPDKNFANVMSIATIGTNSQYMKTKILYQTCTKNAMWQCSHQYIYSPSSPTSVPPSPILKPYSSVDIKHHVYLLTYTYFQWYASWQNSFHMPVYVLFYQKCTWLYENLKTNHW